MMSLGRRAELGTRYRLNRHADGHCAARHAGCCARPGGVDGKPRLARTTRPPSRCLYAADAGVERAIGDLRPLATWRAVPATASGSADFNDGVTIARAPDGAVLDLAQLTARRQAESDALYPNTPDRPVWRLFAHASLNRMIAGSATAPPYVIVWIGDDLDEVDGDPATDTNDVVMIHAEAFGTRGGRRAVEATIQREEAMAAGLPGS